MCTGDADLSELRSIINLQSKDSFFVFVCLNFLLNPLISFSLFISDSAVFAFGQIPGPTS